MTTPDPLAPERPDPDTRPTPTLVLTGDAWWQAFNALTQEAQSRADRYPPGHVTDVSREAMYEGCGE